MGEETPGQGENRKQNIVQKSMTGTRNPRGVSPETRGQQESAHDGWQAQTCSWGRRKIIYGAVVRVPCHQKEGDFKGGSDKVTS